MMELRCRLLDRFGDLAKIPLLRFLYVDSDKDALLQAQRGAPELALTTLGRVAPRSKVVKGLRGEAGEAARALLEMMAA